MDTNTVRVTRSLRKRINSTDVDSSGRADTPIINELNVIPENLSTPNKSNLTGTPRRSRKTSQNEIDKTPANFTPGSRLTRRNSNTAEFSPAISSPLRRITRRLSISIEKFNMDDVNLKSKSSIQTVIEEPETDNVIQKTIKKGNVTKSSPKNKLDHNKSLEVNDIENFNSDKSVLNDLNESDLPLTAFINAKDEKNKLSVDRKSIDKIVTPDKNTVNARSVTFNESDEIDKSTKKFPKTPVFSKSKSFIDDLELSKENKHSIFHETNTSNNENSNEHVAENDDSIKNNKSDLNISSSKKYSKSPLKDIKSKVANISSSTPINLLKSNELNPVRITRSNKQIIETSQEQLNIISSNEGFTKSWSQSFRGNVNEKIDKLDCSNKTEKIIKDVNDSKTSNKSDQSDLKDESENEEEKVICEFLDVEAEDTNGEESMDEEERNYLRENEVPEYGESLGSEDSESINEEEDKDDNSFIVSDNDLIDLNENSFENNSTNKKLYKRIRKQISSESEDFDESINISNKKINNTSYTVNQSQGIINISTDNDDNNENEVKQIAKSSNTNKNANSSRIYNIENSNSEENLHELSQKSINSSKKSIILQNADNSHKKTEKNKKSFTKTEKKLNKEKKDEEQNKNKSSRFTRSLNSSGENLVITEIVENETNTETLEEQEEFQKEKSFSTIEACSIDIKQTNEENVECDNEANQELNMDKMFIAKYLGNSDSENDNSNFEQSSDESDNTSDHLDSNENSIQMNKQNKKLGLSKSLSFETRTDSPKLTKKASSSFTSENAKNDLVNTNQSSSSESDLSESEELENLPLSKILLKQFKRKSMIENKGSAIKNTDKQRLSLKPNLENVNVDQEHFEDLREKLKKKKESNENDCPKTTESNSSTNDLSESEELENLALTKTFLKQSNRKSMIENKGSAIKNTDKQRLSLKPNLENVNVDQEHFEDLREKLKKKKESNENDCPKTTESNSSASDLSESEELENLALTKTFLKQSNRKSMIENKGSAIKNTDKQRLSLKPNLENVNVDQKHFEDLREQLKKNKKRSLSPEKVEELEENQIANNLNKSIGNTEEKKNKNNYNYKNVEHILNRCDDILEAANRAKREEKIQNNIKNKENANKLKKKKKIEYSSDNTLIEQNKKHKRIKLEVNEIAKALQHREHLIKKKAEEYLKKLSSSDNNASKFLPTEILEKIVNETELKLKKPKVLDAVTENYFENKSKNEHKMKRKSSENENVDIPIKKTSNVIKSVSGTFVELPVTPKNLKSNEQQRQKISKKQIASGSVFEEPITPESKKIVNGFKECHITPKAIGFKVRNILSAGQKEPPSMNLNQKTKKSNRIKISEPITILPKPIWTSSGEFVEEKLMKSINSGGSVGTNFYVTALEVKQRKKLKTNNKNNKMEFKNSALEFKQKNLIDANRRETSKEMMQRKARQNINNKF